MLFVKWAFMVGNTLVGSGSTLALSSIKDNINSISCRLIGCSRYVVRNSAIMHTFIQLCLELIKIFKFLLISIAMNNALSLNPLFPVRKSMQVVYNITLPLGWGILILEPDPSNGKECQGRL